MHLRSRNAHIRAQFAEIPNQTRKTLVRGLIRSAVLVFLVTLVGTIGYWILTSPHVSFSDALYMTVITVTTIGFGEVIETTSHPGVRWLTMFLSFMGVGTVLYFFSSLTAFMLEGAFDRILLRRRMEKRIGEMSDHFIVCGGGRMGRHIVNELVETNRDVVLIEQDQERIQDLIEHIGDTFLWVAGDATHDETLIAAGIERAAGLAACTSDDNQNLIITFSARMHNANLRIAARCRTDVMIAKMERAGASSVVSTNKIGGLRLVSAMIRPAAVSYFDQLLRDEELQLRVESLTIGEHSKLANKTLRELRGRHFEDLLVIALRDQKNEWRYNPTGDERMHVGSCVIFISGPESRLRFEQMAMG